MVGKLESLNLGPSPSDNAKGSGWFEEKLYDPILWIGLSCLEGAEPLWGDNLLLTTKSLGVPGNHLNGLVDREATQWFWTQNPWIGNPEHWPPDHFSMNPWVDLVL